MEKHEKAAAVALWLEGGRAKEELSFAELYSLAATAGVQVLAGFTQNRSEIDNRYYIGPGKAEEIGNYVRDEGIDTVIFDRELSPSQVNNLERIIPAKIIDRSELIMDIFAQRASSREGQLQVELAQLRYQLPKLMGRGRDLSRLAGGIGTRGPGETKLEVDRRRIRQRIHVLEQELKKVEKHRALLRKRRERRGVFQTALVGYTNSGKSTLLNQLTKAEAYTDNILFATLDPLSRRLETQQNTIVLTDTVGFISGLPHHLIAAFKGTLEVVVNADLLIHVVDLSHPDMDMQIEEVNKVLRDLGCLEKDQIIAANKIDLLPDLTPQELAGKFRDLPYVPVSALTGLNTDKLLAAIEAHTEPWEKVRLLLPLEIFRRLSSADMGSLLPLEFTNDNRVKVEAELPASVAATLRQYASEN
ncbi:MAG: GTPase HflX [Eubacteriales bacterium]|nr:GTPase HflX [Eubacteriales bacterium]